LETDADVPGLYRLVGFPDVADRAKDEIVVSWASDNTLIASLTREGLGSGQGAGGPWPVTITAKALVSGDPFPDTHISVYNSDDTALITTGLTTDPDGIVVLGLATGVYHVWASRLRTTWSVMPVVLTVLDHAASVDVLGTSEEITPPIPGHVVLYGWILDPKGNPIADAEVQVALSKAPQQSSDGSWIDAYSVLTTTNVQGYFELQLVLGLWVSVEIPELRYAKSGRLPTTSGYLKLEEFAI